LPLEVMPFDASRPRNAFDCGRRPITNWYKNKSKQCVTRLEYAVFECIKDGAARPVGYYALQVGNESMEALTSTPDDFTKNYTAFPAVHLAFLGVDINHQRQGVGSTLLSDVFDKVYQISLRAGLYALTLQSIDEHSTAFYRSLGFVPYSDHPTSPKLLMPIRTIRDLVEGSQS
jgi:GNAT superfamily N-acetyltransferase